MIFFYIFTLYFKVLSGFDTFAYQRTLNLTRGTFACQRTLDLTKDTFACRRTINLTNNPTILQRILNLIIDIKQLFNTCKYEQSQKN